jgi:excisionase family DNA binding protein
MDERASAYFLSCPVQSEPNMAGNSQAPKNSMTDLECHYVFDKPAKSAVPFAQRVSCSVSEACAVTGLGRTKLYELIGSGVLDTTLIGRRRLVSVKSLIRLVAFEPATHTADN